MIRIAMLILVLLSTQALAQSSIYRTTDENGNVVFTDAPPAGTQDMERIENQQINSMPPPPDILEAVPNATQNDDEEAKDYAVAITSPANETTIPNGPGNFSVSASVSPSLASGLGLQLYLDGVAEGKAQSGGSWSLLNVNRGEHQLTVGVVNRDGDSQAMSEPVTVFVFRPIAPPPPRAIPTPR